MTSCSVCAQPPARPGGRAIPMAVVRIALLVAGVAGAILRPFRLPSWAAPVACAVVTVGVGGMSLGAARRALGPLSDPIAFLLAAVPLALLLDQLGFFSSLADVVIETGRGSGALWILAAGVTTVLNLDAAVVLLTPLYVRVARRSGRDVLALAFQPVLVACLASSALPVSNLTNLIAASWTGAGTLDFLSHLALPSLAATAVGWWCYRRVLRPDEMDAPAAATHAAGGAGDRRRALSLGGAVVGVAVAGFVAGRAVGLAPWMVAVGADVVLVAVMGRVPWRFIPVGTALVAASLGVLAAAAVAQLHVERILGGAGTASVAGTLLVAGVAANLVNNLPALLVALPALGHHRSPALWAVLMGVNMGPVVLVTGSLASLLWLDALARLGVRVRARDFTRVGVRVGLPAAMVGFGVFVALDAVLR